MRLLHLHSGNLYGGVECVLGAMARTPHLSIEHEFAFSFDARIAEEIRSVGRPVHILGEIRARNPFRVGVARARVAALCRGGRFDAVVAHSAWSMALLAPAASRPLVYNQHDLLSGRHWTERWARRIRPDLVIANSACAAETTPLVYTDVPIRTVHPPVQLPSQGISAVNWQRTRDSFGTPADSFVLLQAGRFDKLKGQELLLESLALVDPRLNWFLWIAGEAQRPVEIALRDDLINRARALGLRNRVVFLGHISDMTRLMQCADIYCQPNIAPESFGLTFIEALHVGLPILATGMGGAEEILLPNWGVLAEPERCAVAAGIEQLLEDPALRACLSEAGPVRARQLCDPRTQLAALANAIASVSVKRAVA
jgi:glycosyltransferase involved in cell wall biosynthesis